MNLSARSDLNAAWKPPVCVGAVVTGSTKGIGQAVCALAQTCMCAWRGGVLWRGDSWRFVACRFVARRGVAWRGVAWRGVAWRDVAWRDVAWRFAVFRGVAWRGVAWRASVPAWIPCACMRRAGTRASRQRRRAPQRTQACTHALPHAHRSQSRCSSSVPTASSSLHAPRTR